MVTVAILICGALLSIGLLTEAFVLQFSHNVQFNTIACLNRLRSSLHTRTKVACVSDSTRWNTSENDVHLEELFEFVIEGLPSILAPMSYSGNADEIVVNPPKWRKLETLQRIHGANPTSIFARQDLVDSHFLHTHATLPIGPGDIKVLVCGADIYCSYPSSLDSLLGAVENNPIYFVRESSLNHKDDDIVNDVLPHPETGLFPSPQSLARLSTESTRHVREHETLPKAAPLWYRGKSNPMTTSARRRKPAAPAPLTTPSGFKPSTLSKLKKRLG